MGASNIQAKIKRGLSKAISKTGTSSSEKVYLVSSSQEGTILEPTESAETTTLLKDAVFKSYAANLINNNILAGDRMLVSNDEIEIKQGYTIRQGNNDYRVISVDIKAPASETLVYISQLRLI